MDRDIKMTDVVVRPSDVDHAFETLVKNATEEFGHAPRDVYLGIFEPSCTRETHDEAVRQVDYSALAAFATRFLWDRSLNTFPDRLVAVKPIAFLPDEDKWEIDLKSARVLGKVMGLMRSKHDGYLWGIYHSFRGASGNSNLAWHLFEEIAHRVLTRGWQGPVRRSQPIPMVSDGKNPPTFSSDPSSTSASVSLLSPLLTGRTDTTNFDFKLDDLNVMVDDNRYYRQNVGDNPLFHSFTVGRNLHGTVIISIFRITVSKTTGGSTEGYQHIRKIMKRVKGLLNEKEPNTEIKIAYFLVCPEDQLRRWSMPADWCELTEENDHRGEAFCVRIRAPGTPHLHSQFHDLTEPWICSKTYPSRHPAMFVVKGEQAEDAAKAEATR